MNEQRALLRASEGGIYVAASEIVAVNINTGIATMRDGSRIGLHMRTLNEICGPNYTAIPAAAGVYLLVTVWHEPANDPPCVVDVEEVIGWNVSEPDTENAGDSNPLPITLRGSEGQPPGLWHGNGYLTGIEIAATGEVRFNENETRPSREAFVAYATAELSRRAAKLTVV